MNTSTVDRVAGVWREVFGEPDLQVAPEDNFFALGASSLLGMKLADALGREFGLTLDLLAVLEDPTPAHQAALIDRALGEAADLEEGAL